MCVAILAQALLGRFAVAGLVQWRTGCRPIRASPGVFPPSGAVHFPPRACRRSCLFHLFVYASGKEHACVFGGCSGGAALN